MIQTQSTSNYSAGIVAMLPLIYIAWSDGILSPRESEFILSKINDYHFLKPREREIILSWIDPGIPPSEKLYSDWKNTLASRSKAFKKKEKETLLETSLEMAKSCEDCDEPTYWTSPKTKDALFELQSELGIEHIDLHSYLDADEEEDLNSDFEIQTMQKILDDDFHEFRNKIRTLLSYPEFKMEIIPEKEAYRNQILTWTKALAKQNLGSISYPKAYGGEDHMLKYTALFEMLGYHDLSLAIKFGVHFGLFGGSVLALGSEFHHKKYLKDIGEMDLPGCFAMTETGHGSNVRDLKTTATYLKEDKCFVINTPTHQDGKEYIGNALHGVMATVFAQLIVDDQQYGVHAFLVPLRDENHNTLEGITIEDCGYKLGLNGVDNGRIWFKDVKIPKENLLNKFGDVGDDDQYHSNIKNPSRRFFTMLGTLVGGRVCVPRAGLSAAKSGICIAIKHALQRRQFSTTDKDQETLLLDYPSHQKRLMPLVAKAYALDFALTKLANTYSEHLGKDMRKVEGLAAGLKSYATWFTTSALQECREACGGKGYLAENRIADLKADTDIFTTFEGDNTVLMQLVAKGILSDFSREFHDDGFVAVLKMLSSKWTTSVMEMNPIARRKDDKKHLFSAHFQLAAFRFRERKLLYSVSARMRHHIKEKKNSTEAFLACQNHALAMAEAHIERYVLESFIEQVKATDDTLCKNMLKKLCRLYALSTIEKHKGFYLEAEYMSPTKTKAIRRLTQSLCGDVRHQALPLVQAFGIPNEILRAPIAI